MRAHGTSETHVALLPPRPPPPRIASASVIGCLASDPTDPKRVYYLAGSNVVSAPLLTAGQQAFLRGHDSDVTCMAVSQSGRLMATGQNGINADVCVWDLHTGELLHRLSEHDEGVATLAFSPDERLLVSCGVAADKKIFLWDTETGCIVAKGVCAPEECRAVAFSPVVQGGRHYVFATAGTDVVVWGCDAARGVVGGQKCGVGHTKRAYCSAVFSADGAMVYCGSTSGDVASFTSSGCVLRSLAQCCKGAAQVVIPVGPHFLVGGGDGTVSVFNPIKPPTVLDSLDHVWQLEGAVTSVSRVPDSDSLVVCTAAGRKYLCPTTRRRGGPAPELLEESHVAPVTHTRFAPTDADFGNLRVDDGAVRQAMVSASSDGRMRGWTLDPRPRPVMRAHVKNGLAPQCVAVTPRAYITGWGDGNVRCHDNATGELLWTIPDAHAGGVTSIATANGMHFFVTGGAGGEVRVWDVRTRGMISTLKEHASRVVGLAVLDDDAHVVSASRDRSIITWDLIRERRVSQHQQRVGGINDFALAQGLDKVYMVSVGQDRSLSFWDLMQSQPLQIVPGAHVQECTCVALSRDGVLATGSADQTVKLWDFGTGRLLAAEHSHCGPVRSVTFSADGRTLVSGGDDGIIMVWNVDTARA